MPEAHPQGYVDLELDGLDKPIRLQYDFDDFADADALLDRSVMRELAEAEDGGTVRFDTLRALLFIGARPDERFASPSDVRGLINFENQQEVASAVMEALYAAMPGDQGEGEDEPAGPTEAAGASTTSGS